MKKSECYVGQRVEVVGFLDIDKPLLHTSPKTRAGTIVQVYPGESDDVLSVGIEFDEKINGHNCGGNAKKGHGWYCAPIDLQPIETETEENEIKLTFDSII